MFSEHLAYWGPLGVTALALEHLANQLNRFARTVDIAALQVWHWDAKHRSRK